MNNPVSFFFIVIFQPAPVQPPAIYPSIETTPIVVFPQQPTSVQGGAGK